MVLAQELVEVHQQLASVESTRDELQANCDQQTSALDALRRELQTANAQCNALRAELEQTRSQVTMLHRIVCHCTVSDVRSSSALQQKGECGSGKQQSLDCEARSRAQHVDGERDATRSDARQHKERMRYAVEHDRNAQIGTRTRSRNGTHNM